eukprot:gb/GECG01016421.1/.p1 GENE.gb/GECG01016421.1/~~gb/GECG01016421.1/.p1  ORF type:complete len:186 (+),score=16.59 gb/GECG01016421.1/:1-558(+)
MKQRQKKKLEKMLEEYKRIRKESLKYVENNGQGFLPDFRNPDVFKATLLVYVFLAYYFWNVPVAVVPRSLIWPFQFLLHLTTIETKDGVRSSVAIGAVGWICLCYFAFSGLSHAFASVIASYIGKRRVYLSAQRAEAAQSNDQTSATHIEHKETQSSSIDKEIKGRAVRGRGNKSSRFQASVKED